MDRALQLLFREGDEYEYEPDGRVLERQRQLSQPEFSHYLHVQRVHRDLQGLDTTVVDELLLDQPDIVVTAQDCATIDPEQVLSIDEYQDFLEAEGLDMSDTELLQGLVDVYEAGLYEYLHSPVAPDALKRAIEEALENR